MTTRERILVADASSLILLCKAGVLAPLVQIRSVLVPRAVYDEVCGGTQLQRFEDARRISELFDSGILTTVEVNHMVRLPLSLDVGESEAVSLYYQEHANAMLTDDGRAIRVCRLLGIPFLPSPKVVVELHRLGVVSLDDGRVALERLSLHGRYGADIIGAAMATLIRQQEVST